MDSLRRRASVVSIAATCIALALSGCVGAQSTVSITYQDGAEQVVTAALREITCSEVKATGTEIDPTNASIAVYFDDAIDDHHATASIYDGALVLFDADEVTVSRDGDHLSVTGEGTVQIAERVPEEENPAPGEGFDIDNARESTGLLEAELTCTN